MQLDDALSANQLIRFSVDDYRLANKIASSSRTFLFPTQPGIGYLQKGDSKVWNFWWLRANLQVAAL